MKEVKFISLATLNQKPMTDEEIYRMTGYRPVHRKLYCSSDKEYNIYRTYIPIEYKYKRIIQTTMVRDQEILDRLFPLLMLHLQSQNGFL